MVNMAILFALVSYLTFLVLVTHLVFKDPVKYQYATRML